MIRILDTFFSLFGLIILSPLLIIIFFIGMYVNRSPIYIQQRVGRYQKPFFLLKFRTMHPDTESVATHLVSASGNSPFENLLRRSKLDELPQLWNVLRGEMSLVGPRPCLFNQNDLINERIALGVFDVRPGITGLAQIRGIDMSTPVLLAKTDAQMLVKLTTASYLRYIFLTIFGQIMDDRVKDIYDDN